MSFTPGNTSTWRFDPDGVPWFSEGDLESLAYWFLEEHHPRQMQTAGPLPASAILQALAHERDDLSVSIVPLENGIRGRTTFSKNLIEIDGSQEFLAQDEWLRFTVMHEIGHWALHRHRPITIDGESLDVLSDGVFHRLDTRDAKTPRECLEYHANRFAAFTLMPANPLLLELFRVQVGQQIRNNLGMVVCTPNNVEIWSATFQQLGVVFGVPAKAVRYQLDDIGRISEQDGALSGGWHSF